MNPPCQQDKLQDNLQDSIVMVGDIHPQHITRSYLCVAYARSVLRFFLKAI